MIPVEENVHGLRGQSGAATSWSFEESRFDWVVAGFWGLDWSWLGGWDNLQATVVHPVSHVLIVSFAGIFARGKFRFGLSPLFAFPQSTPRFPEKLLKKHYLRMIRISSARPYPSWWLSTALYPQTGFLKLCKKYGFPLILTTPKHWKTGFSAKVQKKILEQILEQIYFRLINHW